MEHLMMKEPWNQCNECGQFIPYSDFDSGAASHEMVTPSSLRSEEEWETLCKRHQHSSKRPEPES